MPLQVTGILYQIGFPSATHANPGRTIKLNDIVDAMQIQSETMTHYLNKKTGKIVLISQEDADAAESDEIMEEFPEWQQEDIKLAREVWGSNHYIPLPTKFDIHEYDLIVNFNL